MYRAFDGDLFGGKVDMYARETCFCWCFWSLEIPMPELENSDSILVRAVDESLAIQPRDMYWSVLGMMNNPWFRVTITNENGRLKFEHPTHPTKSGGWMERVKKAGGDLTNGYWGEALDGQVMSSEPEPVKEISMKKPGLDRTIELQEFKEHVSNEEAWFIVDGEVYDGAGYLKDHPGGAQSIQSAVGTDATEDFLAIREFLQDTSDIILHCSNHQKTDSEPAKAMMPDFHIGTLSKSALSAVQNGALNEDEVEECRDIFLNSRHWTKATLLRKTDVSWDTRIFTFGLEHPKQALGLPTGKHIMIKTADPFTNNKDILVRSYTPLSDTSQEGTMDILIKIYFKTATSSGGKMTMALDKLPIGSTVECKGPTGRFEYLGNGAVLINDNKRQVNSFRMICGGSGITPIFQVLRAVMQDTKDPTKCVVLDGNRHEEDILCRKEMDTFATDGSERCRIIHTLSQALGTWNGRHGRISEQLLREYVIPDNNSMVLVCGPEALENSVRKILLDLGWLESNLHFF